MDRVNTRKILMESTTKITEEEFEKLKDMWITILKKVSEICRIKEKRFRDETVDIDVSIERNWPNDIEKMLPERRKRYYKLYTVTILKEHAEDALSKVKQIRYDQYLENKNIVPIIVDKGFSTGSISSSFAEFIMKKVVERITKELELIEYSLIFILPNEYMKLTENIPLRDVATVNKNNIEKISKFIEKESKDTIRSVLDEIGNEVKAVIKNVVTTQYSLYESKLLESSGTTKVSLARKIFAWGLFAAYMIVMFRYGETIVGAMAAMSTTSFFLLILSVAAALILLGILFPTFRPFLKAMFTIPLRAFKIVFRMIFRDIEYLTEMYNSHTSFRRFVNEKVNNMNRYVDLYMLMDKGG